MWYTDLFTALSYIKHMKELGDYRMKLTYKDGIYTASII